MHSATHKVVDSLEFHKLHVPLSLPLVFGRVLLQRVVHHLRSPNTLPDRPITPQPHNTHIRQHTLRVKHRVRDVIPLHLGGDLHVEPCGAPDDLGSHDRSPFLCRVLEDRRQPLLVGFPISVGDVVDG